MKYSIILVAYIYSCQSAEGSNCGCDGTNRVDANRNLLSENGLINNDKAESCFTHESCSSLDDTMVLITEGSFMMGTDSPIFIQDGESPEREVFLDNFYLDKYEVSNSEFGKFVNVTGYVTEVSTYMPK